jgi:hypothetical protein
MTKATALAATRNGKVHTAQNCSTESTRPGTAAFPPAPRASAPTAATPTPAEQRDGLPMQAKQGSQGHWGPCGCVAGAAGPTLKSLQM